jgi:predicted aminopeptidase
VSEKDGIDDLNQSSKKRRSNTKTPGEEKYRTNNKRRVTWIGYILGRNCHLKHVIGGQMGGMK